jgi:predicted DNA binding protein
MVVLSFRKRKIPASGGSVPHFVTFDLVCRFVCGKDSPHTVGKTALRNDQSTAATSNVPETARYISKERIEENMKHIRITVRPELEPSPSFLEYLLTSPDVTEAHAIDWNRGASATSTHLYGIDGDAERFGHLARQTTGVESVALSETDERVSYAHLELRDEDVPIFGGAADAVDRSGLLVRRPLVYRDGEIQGHIIGSPDVLQTTIDTTPETIDVQVEEIHQFPSATVNPTTTLSERQQETIETALALGYYDTPRAATHEDIADELGLAPNTVSEHLQKGEAALVRAGMAGLQSSL